MRLTTQSKDNQVADRAPLTRMLWKSEGRRLTPRSVLIRIFRSPPSPGHPKFRDDSVRRAEESTRAIGISPAAGDDRSGYRIAKALPIIP